MPFQAIISSHGNYFHAIINDRLCMFHI